MIKRHYLMLGGVAIVVLVGLWVGLPSSLLLPLIFVACPVMMIFMMWSMTGGSRGDQSGGDGHGAASEHRSTPDPFPRG